MGKKLTIYIAILCFALSISGYSQRSELIKTYRSQIGIRELTGKNDGEAVERYLLYTGFGKGNPWCASFVSWCHGQIGVGSPRSAWSPSLFPPDKTFMIRGQIAKRQPMAGDVFGIYFPNLKRIGHVGFIDSLKGESYYITVEGNTNEAGSREGDGVYRKTRPVKTIYKLSSFVND